jgi:hypothetical protein
VEDVELATKLARCRTCDSVFEIGTQLRGDDAVRRRELHPPASVRVARGNLEPRRENGEGEQGYRSRIAIPPSDVELEVRWFQPKAIFTMFFAIIWCGFLVVWYSIALQTPSPGGFMLWFPLLHVAVGVGLAYWSLAMLLNRTRIALGVDGCAPRTAPSCGAAGATSMSVLSAASLPSPRARVASAGGSPSRGRSAPTSRTTRGKPCSR